MTVGTLPTDEHVQSLLKQLVQQVCKKENFSQNKNGETAVLLDCEINSVRYILTGKPIATTNHVTHLSPREEEIVRLITKGYSNKEVAAVLDISPWTVATHLRRIFNKLGVSSRAEMVARVLKEDLLKQPELLVPANISDN